MQKTGAEADPASWSGNEIFLTPGALDRRAAKRKRLKARSRLGPVPWKLGDYMDEADARQASEQG